MGLWFVIMNLLDPRPLCPSIFEIADAESMYDGMLVPGFLKLEHHL